MPATAEQTKTMVAAAIAYFNEAGAEATFAKITDNPKPEFRDEYDLYTFVLDKDGVCVAHPITASLIGRNWIEWKDEDGTSIGGAIVNAATAEGGWASYKFLNPVTGKVEPKKSWVVPHDGYIFSAGIYKP